MEYTKWTEEDWNTLLFTIQREKCILMIGPDAATEEVDGQPRPLSEILVQELAEKLSPELNARADLSNLAQIAQYYRIEYGRNDLEAKVCGFYDDRWTLTSDLHRDLAALPFHLTITTTPDNMLLEALRECSKDPLLAHYHYRGVNPSMAPKGALTSPLIYYLYGITDEPESLVLTENNLIDFLSAVIAKDPPLPHNILSELRDRNKSLLFLGFGFKHWYLRILLRILQGSEKDSRSFALEQHTPRNLDEFQRTILFFRTSEYKITLCAKELTSFVKELRERYEQSGKSTVEQAQDAPMVFLCCLPQNHGAAMTLRDHLNNAGFRVRMPEKGQPVTAEMTQQMDYCVVLQSPASTASAPQAETNGLTEPILPLPLYKQISDFLTSLPNIQERPAQQTLVVSAGLDAQLQKQISTGGPPAHFVQGLLDTLISYGQSEDGRLALVAVLEAAQDFVGQDRRVVCQTLIDEFQTEYVAAPASGRKQSPAVALQNFKTTLRLVLERQQQELKRYQFVIPVKIGECTPLEELRTASNFDVTQPPQLEQLIRLIKRDSQRRRSRR